MSYTRSRRIAAFAHRELRRATLGWLSHRLPRSSRSCRSRHRSSCRRAKSSRALISILTSSQTPCCSAATSRQIPSTPTVSSPVAAAFSTSSLPAKSCRSESSSLATPSNRSAASIREPSGPSRHSIASASFRSANCLRDRHRYTQICFNSCVPAMRRCGSPSRPMWKTTSRLPGNRSERPTRTQWEELKVVSCRSRRTFSTRKMRSPPNSRAPLFSRNSRSGIGDQGSGIRGSWQFQSNPRPLSTDESPTGSPTSSRRRRMAITLYLSPARTAAPSAPSNC